MVLMKVCDRHFAKDGSSVRAVGDVKFGNIHEAYDLCQTCTDLVREFINNPEKETDGTKRTDKATGKAKKKNA
jgi:hypothetical protein